MTRHETNAELDRYFSDAQSWAEDRRLGEARSQRLAWILAGAAATIAAIEAVALAGLVPLKSVVPYTVLVDRQTGHVTTLDPSQPVRMGADDALSRSMLAQYVTARESFDRSSIGRDYRKVMLWSGGRARASYQALMKPGGSGNPLDRLDAQATLQAQVRSVSILQAGQALVRFDALMGGGPSDRTHAQPYVAVIRYRFRDRPLTESDRFINPLGFEVIDYRKDAETAPAIPQLQPAHDERSIGRADGRAAGAIR